MTFEPITSQEDLDKIVGARLAREREKYADYDDLKAAAAAGAEAIAERDTLREELLAAQRQSIATAAGIPVELVVGADAEAMQAHADGIKAQIDAVRASAAEGSQQATPQMSTGPIVPSVGTTPTPTVNPLSELFG